MDDGYLFYCTPASNSVNAFFAVDISAFTPIGIVAIGFVCPKSICVTTGVSSFTTSSSNDSMLISSFNPSTDGILPTNNLH